MRVAVHRVTWSVAALAGVGLLWLARLAVAARTPQSWLALLVAAVLGGGSTVLAVLVGRVRPDQWLSPLLAATGLAPVVVMLLDTAASPAPGARPPGLVVALDQGVWVLWYLPVAVLVLCFPEGLPESRAVRVLLGLLVLDSALLWACASTDGASGPGPSGWRLPHVVGTVLSFAAVGALWPLLACCVVVLVRRFRRGSPLRRRQLTWLAVPAVGLPASLLAYWVVTLLGADPGPPVLAGLSLVYLGVPAAAAVAVLRHDLLDLDEALASTLRHALVSLAVVGCFTVLMVLGGLLVGDTVVTAVTATAGAALLLTPIRAWTQRGVDRLLFPAHRTAVAAVAGLQLGLGSGSRRPEELRDVLATALRCTDLHLGFRVPGSDQDVDLRGVPVAAHAHSHAEPILLGGTRVATVYWSCELPRSTIQHLTGDLAPLAELIRLRLELRAALHQVEHSSARLVRAGDQERRRLERDLHDGAQQRLVSLGMTLRLAQRHLDEVDVNGVLDEAVAELGTAVAELRRIAHGIRPAALDAGLVAALRSLTASLPDPIQVKIASADLPDAVDRSVQTTAYYVASEALTNTVKHAAARSITIELAHTGDILRLSVTDDGVGGARPRPGSGLSGLTDRVIAQGGQLRVHSPAAGGTRVEAELPCAS